MKNVSSAAKEIWSGGLRAIGALLVGWLITRIPIVKEWATDQLSFLGAPEKAALTISLAVLSLTLLVLWIRARFSLSRLRSRKSQAEQIDLPQEQVAILRHLSAKNGDYFALISKSLDISHERLVYHLEALRRHHMTEGRSGGPYNILHAGRQYLHDQGLL
jgi:DNA-binding transcriptional ArsR family regulator